MDTRFDHRPLLLVLTGFMGTGKTSVGQVVAEKLGREFVDMDVVIEAKEGMPISKMFETRGEAYFRALEAELCARLARRDNAVIATGGGALVNPDNRAAFVNACVICLDATAEALLARLESMCDRPMLGGNARIRIPELLSARRAAYAQIARHIDTTNKSIAQIADEVIALFKVASDEPR